MPIDGTSANDPLGPPYRRLATSVARLRRRGARRRGGERPRLWRLGRDHTLSLEISFEISGEIHVSRQSPKRSAYWWGGTHEMPAISVG